MLKPVFHYHLNKQFFIRVNPVIDPSVRELCTRPYPLHKNGCPNFSKRVDCPPTVCLIGENIDLTAPVYAVYNVYNFDKHVNKMRDKHPNWSDRQLRCCLYWQPTARKQLREKIEIFLQIKPGLAIILNPEAQGVNVTATMEKVGIRLEWPPEKVTYQIALAGKKLTACQKNCLET